jgi:hypothetical protein
MDGGDGDAGDSPLSAYCSVPLQPSLVLVDRDGYKVIAIVNISVNRMARRLDKIVR